MSRCEDCGAEHAVGVEGQPCPCCAGDTTTLEPCPDCDRVPADRGTGYAVTVWVDGPATQEEADALVERLLEVALPSTPQGSAISVVRE